MLLQQQPEKHAFFELYRHTLSNGLRIWCVPRAGSQTVALLAQLPVGVQTETEHNNGISHFLEHMVFTGTERWSESEVTDVVRRRGGECNAQTSREETDYYIHVGADDLAFGLDWLDQILFKATLSGEKFEKERQVIINEKGGENDYIRQAWEWIEDHNLGWSTTRAVRRRLLPREDFLLPVIGSDKSLQQISQAALRAYYHTHYVPNNLTLLVVGDVSPDDVFALTEAQFGAHSAGPSRARPASVDMNTAPFHIHLHGPTPTNRGQLLMGSALGPADHPDRFGWWVIAEMLENAYIQEIRYQHGASYDVQVYTMLYQDGGYFNIYTSAKVGDLEMVRQSIEKHLDRLVTGNFTSQELAEAKAVLRGRALLNLQDNLELAWWLSTDSLLFREDHLPLADYFAEIDRLSADGIQRLAQRYLSSDRRFSVQHRPAITPKRLRPLAAASALGVASAAMLFAHRRKGTVDAR
ncbi:MAG: insulinase family protein [Chloroflexi bacterium]|nr:insulinase family protein [Chloroflexota bacterium]